MIRASIIFSLLVSLGLRGSEARGIPTGKIAGGEETKFGELPYQLFLSIENYYCGGTLVHLFDVQFVLTAGHCVWRGYPWFNTTIEPRFIKVLAGAWDITNPTWEEKTRSATRVMLHPLFSDPHDNDIALVFLTRPFPRKKNIIPLPMPQHDWDPPPFVTISGWGDLWGPDGLPPPILHKIKVYTVTNEECEQVRGTPVPYSQFCTTPRPAQTRGTCQGDSGGPVVGVAEETNKLYPFGVVSFGPIECGTSMSVHTYVPYYMLWISEKVHQYKEEMMMMSNPGK